LDQFQVTYEQIQAPHWERSRVECCQPGEYLVVEDTTGLDFTGHPAAPDLGIIGDARGRGFHLHSSLALRVEGWKAEQRPAVTVVGLVGQQCSCPRPAPEGEKRRQMFEDITTAIQTGWAMLGVKPAPRLKSHQETKLLIADSRPASRVTPVRINDGRFSRHGRPA
jgi:hypothetical protein